jgi:hypothetical protein
MNSKPTTSTFPNLSSDEILYHYYSYDGLQYTMDILKGFYETYMREGQSKTPYLIKSAVFSSLK